ncbi:UDP-glucuronosyltransferase 2C1-like [Lytechinus variegatus]|uniref:UDP-glucuronosyltransferase 2C1-like n=1 Tax=Lytechinus variegatus TaxID=7654 RepID=UPI001BB15690|nr:UDP-glucuronosyltransferase 2C1-like [Lytechinus variegatus]
MAVFHRIGETVVILTLMISLSTKGGVDSYNVLLSANFGDGSHYIAMRAIGESLMKKGHEVTFLVAKGFPHPSIHSEDFEKFHFERFNLPGLKETLEDAYAKLSYLTISDRGGDEISELMETFQNLNRDACSVVFKDSALLERLSTFDVFVFNIIWPCSVYVKSYLERQKGVRDIQIVAFSNTNINPYVLWEAASPFFPSFQPSPMSRLTPRMNFFERLRNTLTYLSMIHKFRRTVISEPFGDLIDEYDLDPYLRIAMNNHVNLYLVHTDFSIDPPFAMTPSVIPVGGLTARAAKALDNDVEEFMKSSGDDGVVVFSLGSYFSTLTTVLPEIPRMFLEAFAKIPQKVIILSKVGLVKGLPENVRVIPWLPLNDLLGHSKTRLLVYHGGSSGIFEAVYHGVPLVVMPLGGDQSDIAVRVVSKGIGVQLDKDTLTAENIYERVTEVLSQPEYSESSKRISAILRDRPMTAADTSAYWIEHMIKHGVDYLRPSSLDLPFYQLYLIDVFLFLFALIFIVCWIFVKALNAYFQRKSSRKLKRL